VREWLKIFVPAEKKPQAEELLEEIFAGCAGDALAGQ